MSGEPGRDVRARWSALVWIGAAMLAVVTAMPLMASSGATASERAELPAVLGAATQRLDEFSPAPTAGLHVAEISVSACGVRSIGSGFVAAQDLVITAAHVVGDAGLVRIDLGGSTATGEVLGVLADGRDLAVIEVDTGTMTLPVAGRLPNIGDEVTLVGHPLDGPRTVTVGARTEPLPSTIAELGPGSIGVLAPSGEGFSGGPAVDAGGGLVGVVIAAETGTGTTIITPFVDAAGLRDLELADGTCDSAD